MRIELLSGAKGTARKFQAGDLHDLAEALEDSDLQAEGAFSLVRTAWLQVDDSGPYPEQIMAYGTGEIAWNRVLKGDLLAALFQMRIGSFRDGHIYEFEAPCEHSDKCPPIKWEIDLRDTVLARAQLLPDSSREHVLSGSPLVTRLYNPESGEHDGPAVSFRLQTVENEGPIERLRRKQLDQGRRKSNKPNIVDQIASQVVSVEGQNLQNERQVWQWARKLDLDDALDLQQAFEAADCGYDTEIEICCNRCRRPQTVDLPLQKSFLVPSRRAKPSAKDEEPPTPEREAAESGDRGYR